jgi:hypothetical protein
MLLTATGILLGDQPNLLEAIMLKDAEYSQIRNVIDYLKLLSCKSTGFYKNGGGI